MLLVAVLLAQLARAQTYTFLTWNIRYDNAADGLDRWDLRKETLAGAVLERHPHVIGLQEGLAHQLEFLDAQWPRYRRFGVGREDGIAQGEFSPVYYDTTVFTLAWGTTIWLAPDPSRPGKGWDAACERIATVVALKDRMTDDSLWVVNTHWDHVGEQARWKSAAMIQGVLKDVRARGQRFVVMGDLNAPPRSRPIKALAAWMSEACPSEDSGEGTFNGFGKAREPYERIDYIWMAADRWDVLDYEVGHPMRDGRQVSDHFPVIAVLRVR